MYQNKSSSDWKVKPAPHGGGECASRKSENVIDVIAPPGVIVNPPETMEQLREWRAAQWRKAEVDPTTIATISLANAEERAPNLKDWMQKVDAEARQGGSESQAT